MRRTKALNIAKPKSSSNSARIAARKRGLTFNLTEEQYQQLANAVCFYCGEEKSTNGIDRVLNEVGYEYYNCVSCCVSCNSMKSSMMIEDFLSYLSGLCSRLPEVIKHLEPLRQMQAQFETYKNEMIGKLQAPKPTLRLPSVDTLHNDKSGDKVTYDSLGSIKGFRHRIT